VTKQVELPFRKALDFALKSIRIRFWRSMITAGGVFLGIAFLASVLVTKSIAGPTMSPTDLAKANWQVGLSLLVCAVGITNSMLMSVSERFREIGTMKCLGALNQFVVKIFMIEAVLMGLIASSLGWVLGTAIQMALKAIEGVPKTAPAGTVWYGSLTAGSLFGFVPVGTFWFCVILGTVLTALATFIPARQAASIPPAAALRSDV
jgi:hypothetical protein